MSHTTKNKLRLLNRLRRIRGQIEGIERALESEAECGDVLQRIAAARGAMNGLMAEVLEGHVQEHVLSRPSLGSVERERFAKDLLSIVRTYLR